MIRAGKGAAEATWRKLGDLLDLFSPAECANYLSNAAGGLRAREDTYAELITRWRSEPGTPLIPKRSGMSSPPIQQQSPGAGPGDAHSQVGERRSLEEEVATDAWIEKNVEARPAEHDVVAGAANEPVISLAAEQDIVSDAAIQDERNAIGSNVDSLDDVIAGEAVDRERV